MKNNYFQFKQFIIYQDKCAMKICTDSCVFGASLPITLLNNKIIENALEIGTGTGLLSLQYAQLNEKCNIESLEIERNSYLQATENIANSPFAKNIKTTLIDFNLYTTNTKFDLLFCNPPFYENDLKSNDVEKNMAHHSTQLTLKILLEKAKQLMYETSILSLLVPFIRKNELEKLAAENNLFVHQKIRLYQTEKHNAFRIIYFLGTKNVETLETDFYIKQQTDYSEEFKKLLAPFYLHL
jgi:tRNA1Val (adenine37-N6)-methyltransferase